jgi:hypothetical protein
VAINFTRAAILLRDNAGNIAKVVMLVAAAAIDPGGGAIAALQAAMQAVTKAVSPRAESGGVASGSGGPAVATDYGTVEDRLVATFSGSDGSTTLFEVPGPADGIFVTDGVTLDDSNADVIAWFEYIEANFKTQYGGTLTFEKGKRSSKKQMKT